jgi:hypothetical protein
MLSGRTSMSVAVQRATSFVRDLLNVVGEVNEWRHERDAFVAMHELEETRRAPRDAAVAQHRD